MFHLTVIKLAGFVTVIAALAYANATGGYYAREIVIEIALLAILALALDFVAGYGGMVSLCHGAIFGLGAYAYAGMTALLGWPPVTGLAAAVAVATMFGAFVGAVTANTGGIYFIMATLAFGQMAYVVLFESATFGGDDGLAGVSRLDLSVFGINLFDSANFAFLVIGALVVAYILFAVVLRSAFGQTLVGLRVNEARMAAMGLAVWRHKAAAFALSAAVAGFAGALAAQHVLFVSPDLLLWTVSGEALVVVILGGIGTLTGPLVGAALFVLMRHQIGAYTDHWHLVAGLVLIATVFLGGRGLFGELEHRLRRRG